MNELHNNFKIPHDKFHPLGDTIVVFIPATSKKVGSMWLPDQYRDMMQSNIMVGKIFAIGRMAFKYKDDDGIGVEDTKVGDWVAFRPHAGTFVINNQVTDAAGYRYLSAHRDVLGYIRATDMPREADEALKETPL